MSKVGEIIAGRYQLESELGEGGSASVMRAVDLTLQKTVAIKILYSADERHQDRQVELFLREARLACAVHHPNVAQTLDFGVTGTGRAFMIMELLEGEDLGMRMDRTPPLTLQEIVELVSGVLRGLGAIHDAGIVHRDVKPENVFLISTGGAVVPKIIDFGIAHNVDPRSSRRSVLTSKEGVIVGTPEYMSPEHIRGVPDLDKRSDLWSVGVMLFELLTGKLPYDHPQSGELVIRIATTDAQRVSELRPEVPVALSEVVRKALSRDRATRYQDATQMLTALSAAALGAASSQLAPPGTTRKRDIPVRRTTAVQQMNRRPRLLWPALGAALVLVSAAGIWRATQQQSPPPATHEAEAAPQVSVRLLNLPAGSHVLVDGSPAAGTDLLWPRNGALHRVEVVQRDEVVFRVMHPALESHDYDVSLLAHRVTPTPTPTPTPSSAPAGAATITPTPAPAPKRSTKPAKGSPAVWRKLDF